MNKSISKIFNTIYKSKNNSFITNILKQRTPIRLILHSVRTFAEESSSKFGQIEQQESLKSSRQGKHNLRNTLTNSNLRDIFEYLDNNINNFSDGDYLEALHLVSNKFENDAENRFHIGLLSQRKSFEALNQWIRNNCMKHTGDSSNAIISYIFQLQAGKGYARIFQTRDQQHKYIDEVVKYIEENHKNISFPLLISLVTNVSCFTSTNLSHVITERDDAEVDSIFFISMIRTLKRITNTRVPNVIRRAVFFKLLPKMEYLFDQEKLYLKAKAFNIITKLNQQFNGSLTTKAFQWLSSIEKEQDNYDFGSILNVTEGLLNLGEKTNYEVLRDVFDIVALTIQHGGETVKYDFLEKFLHLVAQFRGDAKLNPESAKTIFGFIAKDINDEFLLRRVNVSKYLSIFNLIQKIKFQEKEIITELLRIPVGKLNMANLDRNLNTYRMLCNEYLGQNEWKEISNEVINKINSNMIERNNVNPMRILDDLNRVAYYENTSVGRDSKSQIREDLVKRFIDNANASQNLMVLVKSLSIFRNQSQNNLNEDDKAKIALALLSKIKLTESNLADKQFIALKLIFILSDFRVRNPEVQKEVQRLTEEAYSVEGFDQNLIRNLSTLSQQERDLLGGSALNRITRYIRDLIKQNKIEKNNHHSQNIIKAAHNIINSRDEINSDVVNNFVQLADILQNPEESSFIHNIQNISKDFSRHGIESDFLNKSIIKILNTAENLKFNIDNIELLNKVVKMRSINYNEKKEILNRWLVSTENMESIVNNYKNTPLTLIKFLATVNNYFKDIVTDKYIQTLQRRIVDELNEDSDVDSKINSLNTLAVFNRNLFIEKEDMTKISDTVKSIFQKVHLRKAFRLVENIQANTRDISGAVSRIILNEFSNFLGKFDGNIDKQLFLRILDIYAGFNLYRQSLMNKLISKYEDHFKRLRRDEHLQVIENFAKINLNKEDVVRAALEAFSGTDGRVFVNDSVRALFAITHLGFEHSSWATNFIQQLYKEEDKSFIRLQILSKINLLNRLWSFQGTPLENETLANYLIQAINQNESSVNFFNNLINRRIEQLQSFPIFRRSPYFNMLNENIKESIDKLIAKMRNFYDSKQTNRTLAVYFEQMKVQYESIPETIPADLYFPEDKIGILFVQNSSKLVIGNKFIFSQRVQAEKLAKEGINVKNVDIGESIRILSGKDHHAVINYLQFDLGITNNNKTETYDWSKLNSVSKKPKKDSEEVYASESSEEEEEVVPK